jgi:hypothetical protein
MAIEGHGPWEERPRAGWDEFVAARERAWDRVRVQGVVARLERAWSAPAHERRPEGGTPDDGGAPPIRGV